MSIDPIYSVYVVSHNYGHYVEDAIEILIDDFRVYNDDTDELFYSIKSFGDKNKNKVPDPEEIGIYPLKGDGDFRSEECIQLLKEAVMLPMA